MNDPLGWQDPWPLAGAGAATGAENPCTRRPDQLDVIWTTADGSLVVRSWFEADGWQDPWPLAAANSAIPGYVLEDRLEQPVGVGPAAWASSSWSGTRRSHPQR